MKSIVMMTSVLAASISFISFNSIASEKIVGGEPVLDINEASYTVSLSGVCGGSIISSRWILTAAHCAGHFSSVKAGTLDLNEPGTNFSIKRVVKHPSYNRPKRFSNDFALVELTDEINFAQTGLRPVKIADDNFEADGYQSPGIDSTIYGWGDIQEGSGNHLDTLNKVIVPIVSNQTANAPEAYNNAIDSTMIVAGLANGGKDACQGDSGGPMVVFDQHNDPVQVGVVSWGDGCARAHKYGIYSKVSAAFEWIQSTVGPNP